MPTARERNTWVQVTRRTGWLRPDMSRAILRAGQALRDEPSVSSAVNPVRVQLLLALMAGGQYVLRTLPGRLTFNVLDTTVAPVLYALDQRVTSALVVTQDGLSPQDAADVARFAQRQQGTAAQRARAVALYRNRRIASRAETLARTATLMAFKQGQQVAAGQALREGFFWRAPLTKTWVNMGDGRVRDEHQDGGGMGGQTVEWDRPYSNGEMVPGELTWNCRCVSHFSTTARL